MAGVEAVDEFYVSPDEPSVRLKGGLDLKEVLEGEGGVFEVAQEEVEEQHYFDEEDFSQANFAALGVFEQESDIEEDESLSPFEAMAKRMQDISPDKDGGVMKKIIKHGDGSVVPEGALVRVHYNAFLEYNEEPYDSSRLRSRPDEQIVGQGCFLYGLDIGIASMKRGELARLIVQPDYAYGELGIPPRIPANATIMFEVEMLDFNDHKAVTDYNNMSGREKREAGFEIIFPVAKFDMKLGESYFKRKNWGRASGSYRKAVRLLEDVRLADEKEEAEQRRALLKLYLRVALCNVRLRTPNRVIFWANKALEIDTNNCDALYYKGKGLRQQSQFKEAKNFLLRAQRLRPNSEEITNELKQLEHDVKSFNMSEKEMYRRMFGGIAAPAKEAPKKKAPPKPVPVELAPEFITDMTEYLQ